MLGNTWRAARLILAREAGEQGKTMALLGAIGAAVALALAQDGLEVPSASALLVAIAAPLACVALPASVVDHAASGFVRLVRTQPIPRGAYALMRIGASATLLCGLLAPLVALVAWREGAPIVPALAALALVALWCAGAAVLFGLLTRGVASSTAAWVLVWLVNLLGVLATGPRARMDDWLVRARHAFPGPSALEMLTTQYDPWLLGASLLLALEALLLAAVATAYAARAWVHAGRSSALARLGAWSVFLAAILLPFLLPAARGGAR